MGLGFRPGPLPADEPLPEPLPADEPLPELLPADEPFPGDEELLPEVFLGRVFFLF